MLLSLLSVSLKVSSDFYGFKQIFSFASFGFQGKGAQSHIVKQETEVKGRLNDGTNKKTAIRCNINDRYPRFGIFEWIFNLDR